jgi:hypothetical protein
MNSLNNCFTAITQRYREADDGAQLLGGVRQKDVWQLLGAPWVAANMKSR